MNEATRTQTANQTTRSAGEDRISVIMGVYNCADTVAAAAESILAQTLENVELIVCDDASTDGTYETLQALQARFPARIRLLRNDKNRFLACCLNRCLSEAKSPFIARMDGDDLSFPERLEKQLAYLKAHPEFDMVGTGMRMQMDWGGTRDLYCEERPDRNTMANSSPFYHATLLARRGVFETVGGYTEGRKTWRSEDIDFYCRFFLAGLQGANLREVLYLKSETDLAMRRRSIRMRLSSYRTKLRCFRKLRYPPWPYIRETLRLYKCLVPYPALRLWRKLRQDRG